MLWAIKCTYDARHTDPAIAANQSFAAVHRSMVKDTGNIFMLELILPFFSLIYKYCFMSRDDPNIHD